MDPTILTLAITILILVVALVYLAVRQPSDDNARIKAATDRLRVANAKLKQTLGATNFHQS